MDGGGFLPPTPSPFTPATQGIIILRVKLLPSQLSI